MDRVTTNPVFIAEALQWFAAPACAVRVCGHLMAWNPEFEALLGVSPQQRKLTDLVATRLLGDTVARLHGGALAEQRWDSVLVAGGEEIAVHVSSKPLPLNPDGGALWVFTDLRAFRDAQDVLASSAREQRILLDNAQAAILLVKDGQVADANRHARELLGGAFSELRGVDTSRLFPSPATCSDLLTRARPLLDMGRPFHTHVQLRRLDGRPLWSRVVLTPVEADARRGVVWMIDEAEPPGQDEGGLRRALDESHALFDHAPLAIAVQRNDRVVRYNPQFSEFFGFPGATGLDRLVQELFASDADYLAMLEQGRSLLALGQVFQSDLHMRRQDGSTFWAHAYMYQTEAGRQRGETVWILDDRSAERAVAEATRKILREQKAILDNASVGILFSKGGAMLSSNPRLAEMFGYTQDEMSGRPAADVFPSLEDYHGFMREAGPLLNRGLPYEKAETVFRKRDGSLFWCRVRVKAIDSDRQEDGSIWILEDVTEARQTLVEVQAIMTNAAISILFSKGGAITRYNRGFADMFGYPDEEGLGLPLRALYGDADSYLSVTSAAEPLLVQGKPFQTEVGMTRRDGSTMWCQLIAYLVDPAAPEQGTIWIVEDRTEAKGAEESLRNALLENQAILDNAVLGISVVENGYNLRCNRKMEELFGYGPGEINGLSVQSLYPDKDSWEKARAETAADFRAGRISMNEFQLVRKDGTRFWARLSGRPFDKAENTGRSVWLIDDVTARREAAEAIRRTRDELEVRVLERTAELAGANAQLQAEIVERRQAEARVHHMAYHDSLTGLPNRALLSDRLDRAMLAVQRSERKLAVMFIDLDRFKNINDSLGHLTGDHLLKEVAGRLCRAVRASDTVARLGGDEFVVLVPGIRGPEESEQVAEKIIEVLAAPFPFEGRMLHITPSIGICMYPDDGADVATLMRHADAAMYHAKAAGRNNYQFFMQRMNLAAARHFELETSLRSALANQEFILYFQPIMDIRTRTVQSMEVLLRWRREGEMVMPDQFIPILEENGMIVPVGEWVMREACRQQQEWREQGLHPVPLALNLSPRQFMHRGLVDSIRRVISDTGMDPALLEFEITETALMQHGEQTLEILGQINSMGIRLSIDDFGTGYSSLAYLKRFPVKKIKIDRAFIKDLEESAEDRAIVDAIIALSNSLQLSVVAEGVETEGQYALLQARGCHNAQGYLFTQPVGADAAGALLTRA
jgi:diguanylate cyclase (GGDEF)-like protein/PAS domain S-box-containing protein